MAFYVYGDIIFLEQIMSYKMSNEAFHEFYLCNLEFEKYQPTISRRI